LEIKVPVSRVEEVIQIVRDVEQRIETIVVLGVAVRCSDDGNDKMVAPILERLGYKPQRAKTNLGLGRLTLWQQEPSEKGANQRRAKEATGA